MDCINGSDPGCLRVPDVQVHSLQRARWAAATSTADDSDPLSAAAAQGASAPERPWPDWGNTRAACESDMISARQRHRDRAELHAHFDLASSPTSRRPVCEGSSTGHGPCYQRDACPGRKITGFRPPRRQTVISTGAAAARGPSGRGRPRPGEGGFKAVAPADRGRATSPSASVSPRRSPARPRWSVRSACAMTAGPVGPASRNAASSPRVSCRGSPQTSVASSHTGARPQPRDPRRHASPRSPRQSSAASPGGATSPLAARRRPRPSSRSAACARASASAARISAARAARRATLASATAAFGLVVGGPHPSVRVGGQRLDLLGVSRSATRTRSRAPRARRSRSLARRARTRAPPRGPRHGPHDARPSTPAPARPHDAPRRARARRPPAAPRRRYGEPAARAAPRRDAQHRRRGGAGRSGEAPVPPRARRRRTTRRRGAWQHWSRARAHRGSARHAIPGRASGPARGSSRPSTEVRRNGRSTRGSSR